jgi:hypothetical protein
MVKLEIHPQPVAQTLTSNASVPPNPPSLGLWSRTWRRAGTAAFLGSLIVRHGWPGAFLHFWVSPGDDMLLTAVLHEMRLRGRRRLWLMTQNAGLFEGSPDVDVVLPFTPWLPYVSKRIGWNVMRPRYSSYIEEEDRDVNDPGHFITAMCRSIGLQGTVRIRPYIHLTPKESEEGRLVERQITIQSSGIAGTAPMITKQWFPERFAAVALALKDRFNFVQLGAAADPQIPGAIDLRGKTTLRQSAAILAGSMVFVGNAGFLMHVARATECRSVIVYGGREVPAQSGYGCNENLCTPLPCSPCWRRFTCPYDRDCMLRINPDVVVAAIERQAVLFGTPLAVDEEMIPT